MARTFLTNKTVQHEAPSAPSPKKEAVSEWIPVNLSESEQQDVLRRIQRKSPGIEYRGDCVIVTRPNGSVVRVTMDGLNATSWDAMR